MCEKYQYFNGLKFTRDDKTGYYLNSTNRIRMHRYVWEYYNGKIPKGYCIHHIDHNKSNNDISNLMLISLGKHSTLHGNEHAEVCYEEMCDNLNQKARPKASEWHKSIEGREWHKKHYEDVKNVFVTEKEFVCENCGKKFINTQIGSRFCSINAKVLLDENKNWTMKLAFANNVVKVLVQINLNIRNFALVSVRQKQEGKLKK